jgi:hypothetical protein
VENAMWNRLVPRDEKKSSMVNLVLLLKWEC